MNTTNSYPTGTWQIDPAKTTVTITVKKMGFITVPATLNVTSGTVVVDNSGAVSSVDVSVSAASYNSPNKKRNEHVVGEDFLDAATFPTIRFHADKVSASGGGHSVAGTVSVKGQPSPVTVAVSNVSFSETSGSFSATATLDRNAIGVSKMPSFVIGKDLDLKVNAVATKSS